ncbi:MAG: helix-turn-helix domain-containing protein [Pseudomonadota bacterium]
MTLGSLDIALRTGATALLLLLAALLLRDFGRSIAGKLGAAFALGSAAFAISTAAEFATQVTWWRGILIALSTGNTVVFWLFARALFDDRFVLRAWHGMVWGALTLISLLNCTILAASASPLSQITALALTVIALGINVLAVVQTVSSWPDDLVERRRSLRVFIVASAAAIAIVNGILQIALGGGAPPVLVSVANAATLAVIVATIAWHLTRATGGELFVEPATERLADAKDDADVAGPADQKLIETLRRLMQDERLYRREGLTIGTLAAKLAIPEYRLRRVINQRLGYRNFNAFLNSYRIDDAKTALADPSQAGVPVTTIALDAGFQSLGPFNRAFKTETGLTPTEYRRLPPSAGQPA